jgi:hypothetical protein
MTNDHIRDEHDIGATTAFPYGPVQMVLSQTRLRDSRNCSDSARQ